MKSSENVRLQVEALDEMLEMIKTCRWENIDGSKFMRYMDEGEEKTFYVRPCYQDVYQIVLHDTWQGKKPRPENPQHCVLITGIPGIGKSVFGKILCAVISQRPKPSLIFYQGVQDLLSNSFLARKCLHNGNREGIPQSRQAVSCKRESVPVPTTMTRSKSGRLETRVSHLRIGTLTEFASPPPVKLVPAASRRNSGNGSKIIILSHWLFLLAHGMKFCTFDLRALVILRKSNAQSTLCGSDLIYGEEFLGH